MRDRALGDVLRRHEVRSAVILLHAFTRFAGPSMVAVDLARTLARHGVAPTIAAITLSRRFAAAFDGVATFVDLASDPTPVLGRTYDLVMTQGWKAACMGLLECDIRGRCVVLGSFSGLVPGEAIFGLEHAADALLFHSPRNRELQEPSLQGCETPRHIFGNPLNEEWFAGQRTPPAALRRVVVVSNHAPPEVVEAVPRLRAAGLVVDVVGRPGVPRPIDPALVDGADVIVTIGHTAQKALARARPLYCYDHFGGPGYLTAADLPAAEYVAFSGRSAPRCLTGTTIADEIVAGFAAAAAAAPALRDHADRHYRLDAVLSRVLDGADFGAPRSLRVPAHRNLRKIHQLTYAADRRAPFLRNIGFDYEAPPVVLFARVELAAPGGALLDVRSGLFPPYVFASTMPSPVALQLRLRLSGVAMCSGIVATPLRDGPGPDRPVPDGVREIVVDPGAGTRKGSVLWLRATLGLPVGTRPLAYRLTARTDGGDVPLGRVVFSARCAAATATE